MGKPSVPEPPDYTEIAEASEYAADLSFQIAEDQLAWAMEQYEAGLEVTEPVIDELLQTMEFTNVTAEADRARYEEQYQALEDELIAEAESYATPERIEMEMGRAQAGVAEQTNAAREAAEMSLESYGVNPADVRYASLDIDTRTDAAAAGAAAGQQAALQAEAKGDALRSEALNIGKGYPASIQSAYNTSLTAGTSAASTQNAATQTASNALTQPASYVSTGTEALDAWGNTINTGYQNEMDAYTAQMTAMSGVGTALGTIGGLVLMAEEGGEVPRIPYQAGGPIVASQSPSRGARTDDIPINASAGEFMVPADVASYYGTKKYYNEIKKAREEKAAIAGAVPASPGRQQPMQRFAAGAPPPRPGGGQPMRRPTQPMQPGVPPPAPGRGAIPPVPRPVPRAGAGALPVGGRAYTAAGGGEVPRYPLNMAEGGSVGNYPVAAAHPGAARRVYNYRNASPWGAPAPTAPAPAAPAPAPTAPIPLVPQLPPDYIGGQEGAAPNMQYVVPAQNMQAGGEVDPNYYPVGVDPASGAYRDPVTGQWVIPSQPPPETLPAPVYAPEPVAPEVGSSPYRRAPERTTTAGTSGGFVSGLAGGIASGVQAQQQAQYNEYLRSQQAGPGQLSTIAPQDPTRAPPVAVNPPFSPATPGPTAGPATRPATAPGATPAPVTSTYTAQPVTSTYTAQPVTSTYTAQPVTSTYTPERRTSWDAPRPTSVIEQQRAEQRTAPRVPPPFSATDYNSPRRVEGMPSRGGAGSFRAAQDVGIAPYAPGPRGMPATPYGPARTPRARPAAGGGTTRSGEPARTPRPRPAQEEAGRTVRPQEMRSRGDVTGREKERRLKPGQITAEPESGSLSAESFARQGQDYMRRKKGKGKRSKEGAVPAAESAPRSRLGRARDVAFGKEAPKRKPRKRLDIGGRIKGGIAEMFREDEEA